MKTRTLNEWVGALADERDEPTERLEAAARQHLEELAELDGTPPGEITTWHLTESAARRLLAGIKESRGRQGERGHE